MPEIVEDAWFDLYLSLGFDPSLPIRYYLGSLTTRLWRHRPCFLVQVSLEYTMWQHSNLQGYPGAAMTKFPLLEARGLGYRAGVLNSSEIGYNVYRSVGFQEYCTIYQYVWSVS